MIIITSLFKALGLEIRKAILRQQGKIPGVKNLWCDLEYLSFCFCNFNKDLEKWNIPRLVNIWWHDSLLLLSVTCIIYNSLKQGNVVSPVLHWLFWHPHTSVGRNQTSIIKFGVDKVDKCLVKYGLTRVSIGQGTISTYWTWFLELEHSTSNQVLANLQFDQDKSFQKMWRHRPRSKWVL